jgi:hypothetical protein
MDRFSLDDMHVIMAALYGVLCQIVFLSSLAFDSSNQIVVELATPRTTAPHGVALCFTDSSFLQSSQDVSVSALTTATAGSWRDVETVDLLQNPATSWRSSPFFGAKHGIRDPIEVGSPSSLLNGDKYYDSIFAVEK